MGKKLSEEVAVDSDDSMEDVSDTKPNAAAEDSSSESNSRQADTASSDSESSESEAEAETNVKSSQNKTTKRPAAFRPPPGFITAKSKSRSKSSSSSSSSSSALSNLDGKQIFHIAAPSFLPLSQIREVALDKALLGEPVLNHKGVDYGLPADGPQTTADLQTLLIYDENKGSYVKKEVQNIQSYTVQELVRLPNYNAVQPLTEKPARPQPKHLKMRFHPVGSGGLGAETIGSSSESEADNENESTFRVPRQEQKRKTDNQDQGEKKKKKKDKHASSQEVVIRGRQDGESEKKASKQRDETSQERRARKEKKKRRAEK